MYRLILGTHTKIIGFIMKTYRNVNTYKGKLSKKYAGQASTIHEKATLSYISDFPVGGRNNSPPDLLIRVSFLCCS